MKICDLILMILRAAGADRKPWPAAKRRPSKHTPPVTYTTVGRHPATRPPITTHRLTHLIGFV